MAANRTLQTSFWDDRYVASLTTEHRYLLLYLKLNKHIQVSGCCQLKQYQIALETGLNVLTVREGMDKLQADGKIKYQGDWIAVAGEMQDKGAKLKAATEMQFAAAPPWVEEFLVQGKEVDSRVNHPAIQAAREAMQRFPSKSHWDHIIEAVGEDPDINYLSTCYAEWASRGYNPNGMAWLFQWYIERRIPALSRNHGAAKTNVDRLREYEDLFS